MWKKLLYSSIVIVLCLLGCFYNSKSVSAYSFGSSGELTWGVSSSSCTPNNYAAYARMYFNDLDGTRTYYATPLGNASGIRFDFSSLPSAGMVNYIRLYSYSSIPQNSFVSFYLRYWGANPNGSADVNFNGFIMSNGYPYDISCSNNIDHINGNDSVNIDRTCLLTYYYTGETTDSLYLSGKLYYSVYGGGIQILPGSYMQVINDSSGSGSGLTEAQLNGDFKTWLQAQISNLYSQGADQLTALNQIKIALNANKETSETTNELIQQLIDEQKEEKENLEKATEDAEGSASEAGAEAEEATSNLIETSTNIINAIKDTPATNCNIRIKRGAFDTGELNLCNAPDEIKTAIGAIITIPVTIAGFRIAYAIVILYLETIRKEQE